MSFLNRSQGTADIYCFQEVFDLERYSPTKPSNSIRVPDLYPRLREQLDGFEGFLSNPYTSFGERLAIFARSLNISDSGEIALCDDKEIEIEGRRGSFGSRLQWVTVKRPDNSFTVANVHGIWLPSGKGDTSERMKQSRRIEVFSKRKTVQRYFVAISICFRIPEVSES
jgi:hypothetical protein